MSEHIHSKLLYVFSRERTNGVAENFRIDFGNFMSRNVLKVIIKETVIPNTMYNVTAFNNTIIVNAVSYQLAVGQYDITSFISALQTLLAVHTLVITNDPITYKLTFTTAGAVTYSSQDNGSTMGRLIGLDKVNDLTTASSVLPNIYDLSGPKMLFLYSPELCGNSTNLISSSGNKPALGNFIVNAPFGENITFEVREDLTDSIDMDSYNNLREIQMQLVNEFGEQVDLNGSDYTMVFKIYITSHR